jgi:hypothetical protein
MIPKKCFLIKLAGVIGMAILIRAALLIWIPTLPVSDFYSYLERASNLTDYGKYQVIEGFEDASFPPGYSLMLSIVFHLPFDRVLLAKIANLLLAGFSVGLIGLLGRKLGGESVGILSAVLLAVYPRSAMMPLVIASENLFIPLLFLFILLLLWEKDHQFFFFSVLAGLAAGALTLIRSVAYLLWIFWLHKVFTIKPVSKFISGTLLVVISAHLVILPWALYNHNTLGVFTPFTSSSGFNLFIGNNPNATGVWYAAEDDLQSADPQWNSRNLMDRNQTAGSLARQWITENPIKAAQLYFGKLGVMFSEESGISYFTLFGKNVSPPSPGVDVIPSDHILMQYDLVVVLILNVSFFILTGLQLLGILFSLTPGGVIGRKASLRPILLLILVGLYFPMASAFFLATDRFRWPLTDLWIPFAAAGLISLMQVSHHALGLIYLRLTHRGEG